MAANSTFYNPKRRQLSERMQPISALSFDRVNEGFHTTSAFGPFRHLPLELLSDIIQHLDARDLSHLALVDTDCRQLARSWQFNDVWLDGNVVSMALLAKLSDEVMQRSMGKKPRSIGVCIRRMTVVSFRRSVGMRLKGVDYPEISSTDNNEFTAIMSTVLENGLLNLERLNWADNDLPMAPSLMRSIARCPVQHLQLSYVSADSEILLNERNTSVVRHWALQTLEFCAAPEGKARGSTTQFCRSVIFSAAPTLEHLIWKGHHNQSWRIHSFGSNVPSFPWLRRLVLHNINCDSSVLTAFLHPSTLVHSLQIEMDHSTSRGKAWLNHRGCVPSLKTLIYGRGMLDETNADLEFLAANPQLASFVCSIDLPTDFINATLLPLLSSPHFNLNSLSLIWKSPSIDSHSLDQIASLTSLKQLKLEPANQLSSPWLIDHGVVRERLRNLSILEKLVIRGDTYTVDRVTNGERHYYRRRHLPPGLGPKDVLGLEELACFELRLEAGEDVHMEMGKRAWQEWHLRRMKTVALSYAQQFTNLEFLYIGRRPLKVCGKDGGGNVNRSRDVVPVTEETDFYSWHLAKMFETYIGTLQ